MCQSENLADFPQVRPLLLSLIPTQLTIHNSVAIHWRTKSKTKKNMKKSNLNTILLIIIIVLLIICAYGIYSRPTLEQIDERIMHWGQHFGAVFSN